jgi:hypothetical protein
MVSHPTDKSMALTNPQNLQGEDSGWVPKTSDTADLARSRPPHHVARCRSDKQY